MMNQSAAQVWDTPPNNGVPVLGAATTIMGGFINDLNRATGIRDELEKPDGLRFFPLSLNGRRESQLYLFGALNPAVSPGASFSLNATLVRPTPNYELVEVEDSKAKPISFGPATVPAGVYDDRLYLVLYVTGMRNFRNGVVVELGGQSLPVLYSGAQGALSGLDQINVFLPRAALAGRGELDLRIIVDGEISNVVRIALGN
jgi:hypothetical protein